MGFVSKIVGSITGANQQAKAATNAANVQAASSAEAIAEQKRQFDYIQKLLEPFVNGGTKAFGQQQDILGVNGDSAQQSAILDIQNSPYFQAMNQQGQDAILQNASATGGIRGGNTQAALSQFSPNLLNSLIQQQYSNLGGLAGMGQNSAAQTGSFGANSSNAISNLMQQGGAAQAGGIVAAGNRTANTFGSMMKLGGVLAGFSDMRLKRHIKKIAQRKDGTGVYAYEKFGNPEIGVMAQEVEKVKPKAVKTHKSGYKMVNYSMIGAY